MTQEQALDILKFGHNVFLTGPAGSGKTHVLNEYITYLRERNINVAVTASTGIAATHIGGQTIHSWSGIGIKNSLTEQDLDDLEQKKPLFKRFDQTSVLVIDEISMLGAHQLDMVDQVARQLRHSLLPFGGIQVIFTGDFFQLPPVGRDSSYAFDSNVWRKHPPLVCYLTSQYRHNDESLTKVLSDIRQQNITPSTHATLTTRTGVALETDTTKLFTHNIDVDSLNEGALEQVDGESEVYDMSSSGSSSYVESLKKGCLAPERLVLKVGAKVMFVKNDPAGQFVNGTLGTVVELGEYAPTVETINGEHIEAEPLEWAYHVNDVKKASITQVPLRLAWAITIHKSQGMTLDAADIDLSKTFTPGQGYVALSRVRSLKHLSLRGFNDKSLEVDNRVVEIDQQLQGRSQAAVDRLKALTQKNISDRQTAFIKAAGGDTDPVKIKKNQAELATEGMISKVSTAEKTQTLLAEGRTIADIATVRGLKPDTILSHIQELLDAGTVIDIEHLRRDLVHEKEIIAAFRTVIKKGEDIKLTPIKQELEAKGINVSFYDLRLARLFLNDTTKASNKRRKK
jgi:hypothetical protein